ncbi:MAG: aspartate-semialdehyde dehydrogenase [Phycisphaerales bacterium]|nr:aspartate-semialdehyde dehydrogenase [Planctomycetota bacterium]
MPLSETPNLAIVGATGAVGRELLLILGQRTFGHGTLRLLASARSAGSTAGDHPIEVLTDRSLAGVDLAFFCAAAEVSRQFAPAAVDHGTVVIDHSSAFRMEPDIPLVVPEINGDVLDNFDATTGGIIANPNCSAIIALLAVTPLHRAVGVKRIVISTYQAASGAGAAVMRELQQQVHDHAAGKPYTQNVLGRPYLFNLFSHDSPIGSDGYNQEERKIIRETHKIWHDDSVQITATCVRVPVLRAHCEAINLTFNNPLSERDARVLLSEAPGVKLVDDRDANKFPEPIDATGLDEVLVGRIRADTSQRPGLGLDLFVAGDQLRKGAALNAVQIAERLVAANPVTVAQHGSGNK